MPIVDGSDATDLAVLVREDALNDMRGNAQLRELGCDRPAHVLMRPTRDAGRLYRLLMEFPAVAEGEGGATLEDLRNYISERQLMPPSRLHRSRWPHHAVASQVFRFEAPPLPYPLSRENTEFKDGPVFVLRCCVPHGHNLIVG